MSPDDATARWIDEQVDLALAGDGALPTELADTELGELVQLFAADAAAMASEPMPDVSGVRRRLLEQIGDEQATGDGLARTLVRGTGRSAGWSAGRAWRARRVVMVAGCMVVLCTTFAYADTHTPVGRAVRTAARTLQIPVPAEPKPDRAPAPAREDGGRSVGDARPASESNGGDDARPGDHEAAIDERGVPVLGPDGEPVLGPDGEPVFEPRPDAVAPGDGALPGAPHPHPPQQQPTDDGATQPEPNADGTIPPPPAGQAPATGQQPQNQPQPKPQPKPPAQPQPTPNPNFQPQPIPPAGGQQPAPGSGHPLNGSQPPPQQPKPQP